MKFRIFAIALMLGSVTAACNPFASDPKQWDLEVSGYDVVHEIDMGSAISGVKPVDEGAAWLKLFVSLTNRADEPYEVDWEEDAFVFKDEKGRTRPEELELANLPGYLDTEFGSGETKSGFVVFYVTTQTDPPAGTLTWKPHEGNRDEVDLSDVPYKPGGR